MTAGSIEAVLEQPGAGPERSAGPCAGPGGSAGPEGASPEGCPEAEVETHGADAQADAVSTEQMQRAASEAAPLRS